MWTSTKPSSMMPVTAMAHFLPTADWYRSSGHGHFRRVGCTRRRGALL